jgi:hypothetical protein
MKKKIIIACAALVATIAVALPSFSISLIENSLIQQNAETLSQDRGKKKFPAGTCDGTGPGFTDVKCPGGYVICCWAHTNVYGK